MIDGLMLTALVAALLGIIVLAAWLSSRFMK